MTAAELMHLVVVEPDPRTRRAWLVRAPNAADLVEDVWLADGVCSLRASRLRDLPPGVPAEVVRRAVTEDDTGSARRNATGSPPSSTCSSPG